MKTSPPLRLGLAALVAAFLAAPGCVTINVYFPAAAVEKAADRIIDEVYQMRRDGAPAPKSQEPANPK